MKQTLGDLHVHLMGQVETIMDPTLSGERLKEEIKRSETLCRISGCITENSRVVLAAKKHEDLMGSGGKVELPPLLEGAHTTGPRVNGG